MSSYYSDRRIRDSTCVQRRVKVKVITRPICEGTNAMDSPLNHRQGIYLPEIQPRARDRRNSMPVSVPPGSYPVISPEELRSSVSPDRHAEGVNISSDTSTSARGTSNGRMSVAASSKSGRESPSKPSKNNPPPLPPKNQGAQAAAQVAAQRAQAISAQLRNQAHDLPDSYGNTYSS